MGRWILEVSGENDMAGLSPNERDYARCGHLTAKRPENGSFDGKISGISRSEAIFGLAKVGFPARVPESLNLGGILLVDARVAQLDRVSASEAEGCGFDPRLA